MWGFQQIIGPKFAEGGGGGWFGSHLGVLGQVADLGLKATEQTRRAAEAIIKGLVYGPEELE